MNIYSRCVFVILFLFLLVSTLIGSVYDVRNMISYGGKAQKTEKPKKLDKHTKSKDPEIIINIRDDYLKTPSSRYQRMMREYNIQNYNLDTYTLKDPQIIVIHTAECRTLDMLVNTFEGDTLLGRKDIQSYGSVNVGSHFLIDTDGTIYSSMPLNYIARHVLGLNYTSIGIENVGFTTNGFTPQQIVANQKLIKYLRDKYKSIKYVIGHFEYNNRNLPHYRAIIGNSTNYDMPDRADPNESVMRQIRTGLD